MENTSTTEENTQTTGSIEQRPITNHYKFRYTNAGRYAWEKLNDANKVYKLESVMWNNHPHAPRYSDLVDLYYICDFANNPKQTFEDVMQKYNEDAENAETITTELVNAFTDGLLERFVKKQNEKFQKQKEKKDDICHAKLDH